MSKYWYVDDRNNKKLVEGITNFVRYKKNIVRLKAVKKNVTFFKILYAVSIIIRNKGQRYFVYKIYVHIWEPIELFGFGKIQ